MNKYADPEDRRELISLIVRTVLGIITTFVLLCLMAGGPPHGILSHLVFAGIALGIFIIFFPVTRRIEWHHQLIISLITGAVYALPPISTAAAFFCGSPERMETYGENSIFYFAAMIMVLFLLPWTVFFIFGLKKGLPKNYRYSLPMSGLIFIGDIAAFAAGLIIAVVLIIFAEMLLMFLYSYR